MSKYSKARKGIYRPLNPGKWISPNKIIFRSSIEQRWFTAFDLSPYVIKIASEKIIIPYFDKVKNKGRKYIIDLIVRYKNKKGNVYTKLIEIKSFSESIIPKKPKRITEGYKISVATWITNQCKWEAATAYAEKRGFEFIILTERDLRKK